MAGFAHFCGDASLPGALTKFTVDAASPWTKQCKIPCVWVQSKDSCRIMQGSEVCHENETVERGKQTTGKAGWHSFVGTHTEQKKWGLYSQGVGICGRDHSSEGQLKE